MTASIESRTFELSCASLIQTAESHGDDQKNFLHVDIALSCARPIITDEAASDTTDRRVQSLLQRRSGLTAQREGLMSLVRLLGFTTLACGCVVGRYRELAT